MIKHVCSHTSTSTVTNIDDVMIGPNAIDLRLSNVFAISGDVFTIDEESKTHRTITPVEVGSDGYYELLPGTYEVAMDSEVIVGPDEAGLVIARSSLNRNGCYLTSGLYDSGFSGPLAAVLHVNCGPMRIKPGTRIGQYLNWKAEALSKYDGSYGYDADGNPKQMENRYA